MALLGSSHVPCTTPSTFMGHDKPSTQPQLSQQMGLMGLAVNLSFECQAFAACACRQHLLRFSALLSHSQGSLHGRPMPQLRHTRCHRTGACALSSSDCSQTQYYDMLLQYVITAIPKLAHQCSLGNLLSDSAQ